MVTSDQFLPYLPVFDLEAIFWLECDRFCCILIKKYCLKSLKSILLSDRPPP